MKQFATTNRIVPFILGKPGGGKTELGRKVGRDFAFADGGGFDKVIEFNASLRDPVDLLGTPNNTGECTVWVPPKELYDLRQGRNLLILEELSDASVPMQNGLCGLIHDRKLNELHLSRDTYIIATGNRTEDKSGANRITSKLANRTRRFDFDENIDDWCEWALNAGIDIMLIQFLRFKPNLLSDFDPNRFQNPTPRSWERVSLIPEDLDADLFYGNVAGEVGEGAAAEFTAFRKVAANLPNIDNIIMNPATAPVPEGDPAVMYALTGAIAQRTSKDNLDRINEYMDRLPVDFSVLFMSDVVKMKPEVKSTKAFVGWAVRNASVLV
ncbi:MoxR family ATPase [Paraburkholderia sp. BL10I2N1]|uniref:MoxR family ATPase n=1 Tax=Paraburkholderia sp. BL10I2N1 TaxID=1938796 RepID=UPI001061D8BB|nr:MoxR family ATPase [Paraburkholderia sp. BL10I2N1]